MEKIERVKAALAGSPSDRPPVSVWMHYPAVDQDSLTLAVTQVNFQRTYDYDFIKLMPFGLYSAQDWGCQVRFFCDDHQSPVVREHGIREPHEWKDIQPLSPTFGNWGQQLQLADYVTRMVKDEVPVIQTFFSPLTTAYKLAGERLIHDIAENPDWVHRALSAITETTRKSIIENAKTGIAGIFYATQCATRELFTEEQYNEFGRAYDLPLLEVANNSNLWFNMLHIHGNQIMFRELLDYPVQVLNWHDRQVSPTLKEARGQTGLCLAGGLNEKGSISFGSSQEVTQEVHDTIEEAGQSKLMICPGCVADPKAPEINLIAARKAVEKVFL